MPDERRSQRMMRTLLGAVVVVLGAQSMRFLFGSLTWYLRDTVGVGVLDLVPIALAPFVAGLVLPALTRWLSVRLALWTGLWILVLARLVNQVVDDPGIDLWSSAVATAAFVGLLPLVLTFGRPALVGGLLLGLAVDGAIKGVGLGLDLAYQSGLTPLAAVVLLCGGALVLLRSVAPLEHRGVPWGAGTGLVGLGPLLFFQSLVFQNQGWVSEVTGIAGPQAQLLITLMNVVALWVVVVLDRRRVPAVLALVVVVAAAALAESGPFLFGLLVFLAIPAAGLVWAAMVTDVDSERVAASGTWLVAGMTLFVVLGLAYYVPIDLDVGLTQAEVRFAAAVLLALLGSVAVLKRPATKPSAPTQAWTVVAAAAALPLVGVLIAATSTVSADGVPELRVMTYNIHSSYDTDGRFDIGAIAEVIEESGATVVGLQEIPRGRLISGVTDELTVLKAALGFEHAAFFGTTDPTWGNAILSRYPITRVETEYLPLVGTPMRRGYLGADLQVGDDTVLVISTHLQHVNDPSAHGDDPEADLYPVHHEQIGAILDTWGGQSPAVLVGDFNARPGWRQLDELLAAGWKDSWAAVGEGDGFTANAANPRYRIDYVFHTPDLGPVDGAVVETTASDHFPVVVDFTAP